MTRGWTNWSGSVRCEPTVREPSTLDELRGIVEDSDEVRAAGSGHSFSPLVETDGTLVSLDGLSGTVRVDEERRQARVRAGTTLAELNAEIASHGFALENLGDIDRQTIAGATATGTHGTGEFGVLSTQVSEVELVTADGSVHTVSCGDDAFGPSRVSLGALGVVTEVLIDIVPSYGLELVRRKEGLDTTLANFSKYVKENRNFEFFWFPGTRTAVTKRMNEADVSEATATGSDGRFENAAWRALCEASRFVPSRYPATVAARAVRDKTVVGPSHEVYASPRNVRFNETEYGVPAEEATDAFRDIMSVVEGHDTTFPVEVRYVQSDDIPLSPAYGRDTVFIAVHTYHKKTHENIFEECEEVFSRYDGRPHWGKMHSLTADELSRLYPEWERFQEVREEFDPDATFLNDYLKELFGVGEREG